MNLFELSAKLGLDSSGFESGIETAQGSLFTLENALKTFVFGTVVKRFVGLAQDAVNVGNAFDSSMSQVAATMGVSTEEIQELRDFAKEMGATTKFSAVQAAEGLNYMALAGYDAEKSMKMMPIVLNLAAAGAMDLGLASDMVTDAESALGLTTEETARMVDQMAKTASRSNTNVEQLGDAMLTIGGTAKFMAGGTDRLQTVLGLLADNGIKGSEAGTKLRNIILKLSSPTKDGADAMHALGLEVFDSEGKMKDMQEIIGDLNKAFDGLTEQERIEYISALFNSRDIAAVNALLGTSVERWDQLGKEIADASGSAKTMSETQLGNLTGDITIMKSALEGVKIQFAEGINPALRDIVQRVTKVLSNPKTQKFLKDVGKALGDVLKRITEIVSNVILPRLISLFDDGAKKLKVFGGVALGLVGTIKTVTTVMGLLAGTVSPTGLLLKGLGLLVGAFVAADLAQDDYINNMRYLTDGQRDLVNAISDMSEAHEETVNGFHDSATAAMEEKNRVTDLWKELQKYVSESGEVQKGMETRVDFILGQLNDALGTEYTRNGNIIEQYGTMKDEIDELIAKRAAESLLAAKEAMYTEALQKREEALRNAGKAYDEMTKIQEKYDSELANITAMEQEQQALRAAGRDGEAIALRLQIEEAKEAARETKLSLDKMSSAYTEANALANGYYADIERYETAQMDIFEGNYKEAQNLLTKDYDYSLEIQRKKAANNLVEEAKYKSMLKNKKAAIDEYRRSMLAGEEGFHQEELLTMIKAYNAEVEEARKAGLNVGLSLNAGVSAAIDSGLSGMSAKAREVGKNLGAAIGLGIADARAQTEAQAANMVNGVIDRMKAEAQIRSPSRKGRAIGENIGESVGLGLEDAEDYAIESAENLTKGVLGGLEADPVFGASVGVSGSGRFEDAIIGILADIRDNLGFDMVLDDGTLVGRIDKLLGQSTLRKARGNA